MQLFFDKNCPLCQSAKLVFRSKRIVWAFQVPDSVTCPDCGAIFHEDELRWKLVHLKDKQSPLWLRYRQQSLYVREWMSVSAVSSQESLLLNSAE